MSALDFIIGMWAGACVMSVIFAWASFKGWHRDAERRATMLHALRCAVPALAWASEQDAAFDQAYEIVSDAISAEVKG